MSNSRGYANIVASLRAPRVAICIDDPHFELTAMSALRVHTRLWGGAGNTVIVSKGGDMHPGVVRVLKAHDPDYVTKLGISLREGEDMYPGMQRLIQDDRAVSQPDSHGCRCVSGDRVRCGTKAARWD